MGKNDRRLKGQADRRNPLKGQAAQPARQIAPDTFCVSLKHFDSSQGQSFDEWEDDRLLAKLLSRWQAHCTKPLEQCFDQRFKRYGHIPDKSEFTHPKHVPEDAVWACMHLRAKECVAGHVIGNIFYVVFLDRNHKFWPTEKRNT